MADDPKTPDAEKPAEREYSEFTETVKLTGEEEAARKRRNLWIFWGLMAFIVLIFITTVVRLSQNIAASGGS